MAVLLSLYIISLFFAAYGIPSSEGVEEVCKESKMLL